MQSQRFKKGENFAYSTVSAAATCSFSLTASTRNVLIETIAAWSDLSGAILTIEASGTELFAMSLGSSCVPVNFTGLGIDNGAAQTISCNITGSAGGAYLGVCGTYRII